MAKVWSFNTTVRNPERMQNFLRTLRELEGVLFNEETQAKFFGLQIKKRLYKPTKSTLANKQLVEHVYAKTAEDIPDLIVEQILNIYKGKAVNASARGRTAAGILNRFGLCIASKAKGSVVITELGKKWLDNEIQDQELFFKFFLKWQYPNPIEAGYNDFGIKPFIGTLLLIREVNTKSQAAGFDPVGLSKKEFSYYVPSLINYAQVEEYSDEIVSLRKQLKALQKDRKKAEDNYFSKRLFKIFGDLGDKKTQERDLKDYGDSAVRYFRMSDFIYKRGEGHYIDLSPDHRVEINRLIESNLKALNSFSTFEEYLHYLVDASIPSLPWQDEEAQKLIKKDLIINLEVFAKTLDKENELRDFDLSISNLNIVEQIRLIREFKNSLLIDQLRQLRYSGASLKQFIVGISNTLSDRSSTVTTRPSLDLEWFTSLSLMVLNDADAIKPSYKLGDDGIPTGFMSNLPDIECFYKTFGMIVEVTLLVGRDQWYAEGQPVMRHLRDFEDRNVQYGEKVYGIFVAPHLHRDTLNTFWSAVHFDYEGRKMKIIPLTVEQYVRILKLVGEKIEDGYKPTHYEYLALFEMMYNASLTREHANDWISGFDSLINEWDKTVLEKIQL